ncbi:MAG: hypothetical protein E7252_01800 [Lachnospira sp.]|nr:hypothetical protein [Lachnospira sp.]
MKRIFAMVALILMMFGITACNNDQINFHTYYRIDFKGFSGFATYEDSFDKDALYEVLVKEGDEDDAEQYRTFVDGITYTVSKTESFKNGDKVNVDFTYDKELAKELSVTFLKDRLEIPVTDLQEPVKVDLFADFKIGLVGASPKLTLSYSNESQHEYIKGLTYTINANELLANGDVINVVCNIDVATAGAAGYVYDYSSINYEIKNVDEYILSKDELDKSVLKSISTEAIATIASETASTTGHMLYKATGNVSYLSQTSKETANDYALHEAYFVKEIVPLGGRDTTYVYLTFKGNITNGTSTETVYFVFEYKNPIKDENGQFVLNHTEQKKRYKCGTDYETLWGEVEASKFYEYEFEKITIE